jgi:hypothetical protein
MKFLTLTFTLAVTVLPSAWARGVWPQSPQFHRGIYAARPPHSSGAKPLGEEVSLDPQGNSVLF